MTLPSHPKNWAVALMRALAPHWGALLALALFLAVGLAVLDDYGVTWDEGEQVLTAQYNLDYIMRADAGIVELGRIHAHGVFYGAAFELPLLLVERAFGIQDYRGIHLTRHLLTHLFFLVGGLFAYLLARRLSGDSAVGLFTMLIFLLHPRLYAHSFFNSKDIPFLVLFAVVFFLTHRAFRRDNIPTFVLLGAAVGVLVNLRIMGIVLLAAIPSMRAIDFAFAQGKAERKRVILTTGAFALTAALSVYALLPYLWSNTVERAAEWWTTLSAHPNVPHELFRGMVYPSTEFPADYVPVWFSIASPPFALALGLIGAGAVLGGAVRAPRIAIRSGILRFGLLLIGCVAAPVAAVVLLDMNVYNGWRHLYFLWAPFALLAAWGLHGLVGTLSARRLRAAAYGAAGAGLAMTLASMALIHPNQQIYFNFSVDRVTPDYLQTQYVMDYWRHPILQAVEWLSDNANRIPDKAAPTARAQFYPTRENIAFLPDAARARIAGNTGFTLVHPGGAGVGDWWARSARALHRAQVYGNTILTIERKDDLQAVYDATREREPVVVAAYDIHRLGGAVALVMEPCAPAYLYVSASLRAAPVDPRDLPPWREGKRREVRRFVLANHGAYFDGKCVASIPLPGYPIAEFSLVQWSPELLPRAAAREAMRHAKKKGRLLARSAYDVYLSDGELVYVQEQCDPLETEPTFHVSVFPQRVDDLPEQWRERGHQRFWFDFHKHGALLEEGACVALFPLPEYLIAAIRTAQYVEGGGQYMGGGVLRESRTLRGGLPRRRRERAALARRVRPPPHRR